jgi:hypothetical protein
MLILVTKNRTDDQCLLLYDLICLGLERVLQEGRDQSRDISHRYIYQFVPKYLSFPVLLCNMFRTTFPTKSVLHLADNATLCTMAGLANHFSAGTSLSFVVVVNIISRRDLSRIGRGGITWSDIGFMIGGRV